MRSRRHLYEITASYSLAHTLTCVRVAEAQHRVVEHQQVREPHGRAQVVEEVSHCIADLPEERQRAVCVRHHGFKTLFT